MPNKVKLPTGTPGLSTEQKPPPAAPPAFL
jgi:hypothetical protein